MNKKFVCCGLMFIVFPVYITAQMVSLYCDGLSPCFPIICLKYHTYGPMHFFTATFYCTESIEIGPPIGIFHANCDKGCYISVPRFGY